MTPIWQTFLCTMAGGAIGTVIGNLIYSVFSAEETFQDIDRRYQARRRRNDEGR